LLFAAGKRSCKLCMTLAQARKHVIDPIDAPPPSLFISATLGYNQILPNRKGGKDATALWDEPDPQTGDTFRTKAADSFAKEVDFAVSRSDETYDGRNASGFSGAVAP
jgi:hypothetical protein